MFKRALKKLMGDNRWIHIDVKALVFAVRDFGGYFHEYAYAGDGNFFRLEHKSYNYRPDSMEVYEFGQVNESIFAEVKEELYYGA